MINSPKGTHDIIFDEARLFEEIEMLCGAFATCYGFRPLRTPIFESTELFARGVGDTTDIVTKEMYTFTDKGKRSMTLRPEGTAGIVRSVISNKLYATHDLPLKISYLGPMFRYERPQLGRYRQFNQFGVESIGVTTPYEDVEVIILGYKLLQAMGFDKLTLKINNLGDNETREKYRIALKDYFASHLKNMCPDCKNRYETNPLRILDCKVPSDQEIAKKAPSINDYLSEHAKNHFEKVLELLKQHEIPFVIEEQLVRGLDYYSGTIFEYAYESESGLDYGALGGGGHYDRLVKELDGPELEGVGFALGIDRIFNVLKDEELIQDNPYKIDISIITSGEKARDFAFLIANVFRSGGYRTDINYEDKSFKRLFKKAAKDNALVAVILGENEMSKGVVGIKNLETEEQIEVPVNEVFMTVDNIFNAQYEKAKDEEETELN
ncbi:MAG TPA: histidine--tRNA ligase [Bacilli bacterium]|jgi:histidyl-tRNA synthetase|nr:histidine--tRNA ligase [Bacilli bacterium]